ncbi:MAG: DUF3592 domain-containing protein [Gammaproteobacteria bacterium]|nr:DUF3592 domain-containing protein [Gammaproteobacteria bacterium]MBU1505094.1 DUF3592 domain-containing protein [Gammaproteobacteria bacterium]MBU2122293.1 DUF3592 domain-containing protein [Gammaproteobacteria bacterium]MBU2169901.1 DUF3592 domain-containing protein [Gammaproteobacteria bacterium]MBU2198606.1 DUF3592 domain-containing protein [Gammaproteobacteria bacterium]
MTTAPTFRRFFGLIGWILLVPSTVTALGAAWMLASGMNMLGGTHTAQGRVVALQELFVGPANRKGLAHKSVVEFVTTDGRAVRFTDSMARQNQAAHKVGENVTVRYDAKDPSQAEISSSSVVKVVFGIAMLVGSAVGMAVGWLLLRLRSKADAIAASATSE